MTLKTYPLICTRGVIIFPDQEVVIDVGRPASLAAIENAQDNHGDLICLFSQKRMDLEDPGMDDLYEVGTLCEIRHVRRFDKFIRVKFRGLERVRLKKWVDNGTSDMGEVELIPNQRQDETEEVALVRMIAQAFEQMHPGEKFMSK
ncbi:LON peptidase substrate-binding domain-containing protein, partial [Faecalibaculum rodentium]